MTVYLLYAVGAIATMFFFEQLAAIELPRGVTIAAAAAWPVFWFFEWTIRAIEYFRPRPHIIEPVERFAPAPMPTPKPWPATPPRYSDRCQTCRPHHGRDRSGWRSQP